MCSDDIRDGSDLKTIPIDNSQCDFNNCDGDIRFGMHESNQYYDECRRRARNQNLFTADQKVGPTAINTRQNPNDQRYGYECSEERDYYPYWHPTKWIDIAILTNDLSRCEMYKKESENVKGRWYCSVPSDHSRMIPNNQKDCEQLKALNGTNIGLWREEPGH
jgi:hypothetical protein